MADKRITRPGGVIPSWANDTLINDPGEPWDGDTTKTEPGAGKRDDGWLPDEKPSAREMNQLQNEQGQWLQYLSDIQPQNWSDPIEIDDGAGVPGVGRVVDCIGYDRGGRIWLAGVDGSGEFLSSPDGHNWVDFSPGVGSGTQGFNFVATKRPSDAPVHSGNPFFVTGGNAAASELFHHVGGAWVVNVLAGSVQLWDGVYDPSNQLWLVCGRDITGGTPAMWYAVPGVMTWTMVALPAVTSGFGRWIATNRSGLSVIAGTGANNDIWTSTNGTVWVASAVIAEAIRGLAYDEDLGVFVIVADTKIYTSVDGVVWNPIVDVSPGANFQGIICKGGLWISGSWNGTAIRYSTDVGLTWTEIPIPSGSKPTFYGVQKLIHSPHFGQFMVLHRDTGANNSYVNKSLSVGTANMSATGSEYTPQT